jgi:enediyne biosynthesis protein E4
MRELSMSMGGFGPGLFDFDNDGWKALFVTRGHVEPRPKPGIEIEQYNTGIGLL